MMLSLILALAFFLYMLPACFYVKAEGQADLYGRIEIEQQGHYRTIFQKQRRLWPGIVYLQRNTMLTQKLVRLVGINQDKTHAILGRLRVEVSLEELVWAKLLAGTAMLGVLIGTIIWVREAGGGLDVVRLTPIAVTAALFILPTKLLEMADAKAKEEIRRQVPVFFGIVLALLEAGLPIHTAVRAAARRFEGRLAQELIQLEVEEKRYGNWRKALEEMAYRWEIDSLVSIVLEINGALTKGVNIAEALATQVEELMRQQEDEAAERMNRLSIRLLPLMIVFMGVPLLFLVLGPAFMGIKNTL